MKLPNAAGGAGPRPRPTPAAPSALLSAAALSRLPAPGGRGRGGGGAARPRSSPPVPAGTQPGLSAVPLWASPRGRGRREATPAVNGVKFAIARVFIASRRQLFDREAVRRVVSGCPLHPSPSAGVPLGRDAAPGPLCPGSTRLGAGSADARGYCAQCLARLRGRGRALAPAAGGAGRAPGAEKCPRFLSRRKG